MYPNCFSLMLFGQNPRCGKPSGQEQKPFTLALGRHSWRANVRFLGLWVANNEAARILALGYELIANRGVEDPDRRCGRGQGLCRGPQCAFLRPQCQTCHVHLVRPFHETLRMEKDRKNVAKDSRDLFKPTDEHRGGEALADFERMGPKVPVNRSKGVGRRGARKSSRSSPFPPGSAQNSFTRTNAIERPEPRHPKNHQKTRGRPFP